MVALASDTCQEKIPRDRSGAGNDTIIDGIGIHVDISISFIIDHIWYI